MESEVRIRETLAEAGAQLKEVSPDGLYLKLSFPKITPIDKIISVLLSVVMIIGKPLRGYSVENLSDSIEVHLSYISFVPAKEEGKTLEPLCSIKA